MPRDINRMKLKRIALQARSGLTGFHPESAKIVRRRRKKMQPRTPIQKSARSQKSSRQPTVVNRNATMIERAMFKWSLQASGHATSDHATPASDFFLRKASRRF